MLGVQHSRDDKMICFRCDADVSFSIMSLAQTIVTDVRNYIWFLATVKYPLEWF